MFRRRLYRGDGQKRPNNKSYERLARAGYYDNYPRLAAARYCPPIPPPRNRKYLKSFKRVSGMPVAYNSAMSQPRQILPGYTYLITRRALRRHYLLRPEYVVNNLFIFFLAVLSDPTGVDRKR
jgi:hypothetical protein